MQMQNKIMKESHILTFQNTSYSAVKRKGKETGRDIQRILNVSGVFFHYLKNYLVN